MPHREPTFRISSQYSSFGFFEVGGERGGRETTGKFPRLLRNLLVRFDQHRTTLMAEPSVHERNRKGIGAGGWIAVIVLGALLGVAIWFLFYGWSLTDAQISTNGYIALTLGVVLSML